MPKRVCLATRDLLFRSTLGAVVAAAGATVTRDDGDCDVAVVEIDNPTLAERIRRWRARGIPVLAYGSHGRADLLRAARDAGAVAVPNSEIARRLATVLSE